MTDRLSVRPVQISDAERLAEIYLYYVDDTAVSFEYKAPSAEEFIKRIEHTTEKYPYLVCEKDDLVVGYAYAGAYNVREAYTWTVSMSIYVDKDHRREGIGSAEEKKARIRQRYKGIDENQLSVIPAIPRLTFPYRTYIYRKHL